MKNLLIAIVALGFSFSAQAGELVFSGSSALSGTVGAFQINDEDFGDNSPFGVNAEYYKSMSDALQIGGRLSFAEPDIDGVDAQFGLAVLARFNFGAEMNDSMFAFGGLSYTDAASQISLHAGFGKRFALAENITWQPNVEIQFVVDGDDGADEGMQITLNLLTFSGFLDLF